MRINLRVLGARELQGRLNGDAGQDAMRKFIDRSAIFLQSRARENIYGVGAVDTGRLGNSIGIEHEGDLTRLVGTNLPYGVVVEKGRSAGSKMPPQGALLGWMGRHGIPADAEFQVRRGIAMNGIAPRPFFMPAIEATEQFMESILPDAAVQIEQEMSG